jgi:hypothetical protein
MLFKTYMYIYFLYKDLNSELDPQDRGNCIYLSSRLLQDFVIFFILLASFPSKC